MVARSFRIAVFASNASAAIVAAQTPRAVPSLSYTHPQQLVATDGKRRLNLFCLGTGSPTVLLDAGAGENMMVWRHVQGEIASVTRTCSYDRAGYGFSDPSTRPSDARNAVRDLHRLVQAAIRAPVVYVGHSVAGLYGALLVATHPQDVAGAVLVDPAFAHQWQKTTATFIQGEMEQWSTGFRQALAGIRTCLDLARAGALVKPTTKAASGCIDTKGYAEDVDDILRRELERQYAQPKVFSAALSEYGSFWPEGDQMTNADDRQLDASGVITFGDRPLVVLTRGKTQPIPGIAREHMTASDAAWSAGHAALARTSTRGTNIVVQGAAHHIQFDQPKAVIDAVQSVVDDVRRGMPPDR